MSDAALETDEPPKKRSIMPLLIGVILAVGAAAGGYFAVSAGMLFGGKTAGQTETGSKPLDEIAFIPIDPLTISLGRESSSRHLRFQAQLEVNRKYSTEVTAMLPRVVDVLNSYLRAIEIKDVEEPAALIRIRAQMLRRVQMVTGDGRVRDLLVMEFVLN